MYEAVIKFLEKKIKILGLKRYFVRSNIEVFFYAAEVGSTCEIPNYILYFFR